MFISQYIEDDWSREMTHMHIAMDIQLFNIHTTIVCEARLRRICNMRGINPCLQLTWHHMTYSKDKM